MKYLNGLILLCLLWSCSEEKDLLHVPSPDWRDQIIYFAMTDRFADGNTANNDQGQGEYDPTKDQYFQGGDIAGVEQNLDYIEKLGATAIWLTPPNLNQWWNPDTNFTGYHGYWAADFMATDPHFGSLEEYQSLSRAIHGRDMYLVQDVVVNHTGDYFRYKGAYDPENPTQYYTKVGAPTQAPFDQNDPNDPEHLKSAIYHFTPMIDNFNDLHQKHNYQMSGLDDLNTENPIVREKLIESFQFWIKEAGVDGYRFDTPLYVPNDFWRNFLYDGTGDWQGIEPFAQSIGKDAFYTFGETWVSSAPFGDKAEKYASQFIGTPEKPEMDAVLNFPLQQTIDRVFAGGQPTAQMTYRLKTLKEYFPDPAMLVNFIDNHDMSRFRTKATEEATLQALLFLMSVPGVPCIYYGTEQGVIETRPALFDKMDEHSSTFQSLKRLIELRKNHHLTRHGNVEVLADSDSCPGLLLYKISFPEEESLYFAFNTREETIVAGGIDLGQPASKVLPVLELNSPWEMELGKGIDFLKMDARSAVAFQVSQDGKSQKELRPLPLRTSIEEPITQSIYQFDIMAKDGLDSMFAILNNRWSTKQSVSNGTLSLNLKNLPNGKHQIEMLEYRNGKARFGDVISFELGLPKQQLLSKEDPIGDDNGPEGKYLYPTDATFSHQMDLASASVSVRGNNIEIKVKMVEPLSTVWSPLNGFDHLELNILLAIPGQKGMNKIPRLDAQMPEGVEWNYQATINGWNGMMLKAVDGAEQISSQKPRIEVDAEVQTISLTFPASIIGEPKSLDGMSILITTWDGGGEGGLRPLELQPQGFTFGGGSQDDPKIMDQIWIPEIQMNEKRLNR